MDAPFPGRREDFDNDEAWQLWRGHEVAQLSQLINDMVHQDPELAKSSVGDRGTGRTTSPRPISSAYPFRDVADDPTISRRTSAANRYSLALPSFPLDETPSFDSPVDPNDDNAEFTYIPNAPKKLYKRLVELCVEADLRAMAELQGHEEVSLGILSSANLDILNECALRWRIGSPYRTTCFLDIIRYKYEREEVPLDCVPDAMQLVAKTAEDLPLDDWTKEDVSPCATFEIQVILKQVFLGAGPISNASLRSTL
jgi:hypothetical protein